MPNRQIVARELAEIFKTLAHPDRVRVIEELASSELDVNGLADRLDLPGTRVSQHLGKLRAHRMVEERRDGRHHFYRLTQPELARWIVDGLAFVEGRMQGVSEGQIATVREMWAGSN
ncbi:MAG: metalloregulator ArsR/SmtB family transcription factor [Pseudomonadota bacterium]